MDVPCQRIVRGVLPAIRRVIAVDPVRCELARTEATGILAGFGEESVRSPTRGLGRRRTDAFVGRTREVNGELRQEDRCETGQEHPEP